MELDDLEIRAFGGQFADQVQDQVLGRDVALELAFADHLDGARDFDVQHPPQGPDRGHLRGADAEGKSAQGAVAGGMAVGADHDVARPDIAEFGKDLVADAALVAADVMEFADPLLGHEIPDLFLVAGCLGTFGRHAVIEDDGDLARIPDLGFEPRVLVDLVELVDDQGPVLVRHGHVDPGFQHVSRLDRGLVGGLGQYLFNHCHSHVWTSFFYLLLKSRLFP